MLPVLQRFKSGERFNEPLDTLSAPASLDHTPSRSPARRDSSPQPHTASRCVAHSLSRKDSRKDSSKLDQLLCATGLGPRKLPEAVTHSADTASRGNDAQSEGCVTRSGGGPTLSAAGLTQSGGGVTQSGDGGTIHSCQACSSGQSGEGDESQAVAQAKGAPPPAAITVHSEALQAQVPTAGEHTVNGCCVTSRARCLQHDMLGLAE